MTTKIALSADEVGLLIGQLTGAAVGPKSGLLYDGGNLVVPDALAAAVDAIIANPNWRLAGRQAQLRDYAASARYNKEVGGAAINGVSYATDRGTQAKLSGAWALTQVNPSISIDWKLPDGSFTTLNAAAIASAAVAVGNYVQSCFAIEAAVAIGINDGTITTTSQIDAQFNQVSAG